jgi:sec-independent protein translocase protein TatA
LPGGWELVLVLLVVLVVFGSKRLPDSARALGRSLRILKAETKGLRTDDDKDEPPVALPPGQPRFDPYTGEPLKPPAPGDQRP